MANIQKIFKGIILSLLGFMFVDIAREYISTSASIISNELFIFMMLIGILLLGMGVVKFFDGFTKEKKHEQAS